MDDPTGCLVRDLENEFCPPLDPALFAAIANDYDLSDDSSLQQLRETLDTLRLSAAEQEDAPFDPSGTSGTNNVGDVDEGVSGQSESHRTLQSLESNITSLESDISSLSLEQDVSERRPQGNGAGHRPGPRQQVLGGFGDLCLENKAAYLTEMFPSIDHFTILHALRKCNESVDRSMDVLLNLAFFEEQDPLGQDSRVQVPKGIDGFDGSSGATAVSGRKKRRNRRNKNQPLLSGSESGSPSLSSAESGAGIENKWDNSRKDVDFICARTYLSHRSASSSYHLNSASLPATVHFLAEREAENHAKAMMDDPVTISQVAELQQEYTSISPEKLAGLLRLARNSISAANELAHVMVTVPAPTSLSDIVRINPPSVDLEDSQNQSQDRNQRKKISRAPSSSSSWTPINYAASQATATSHIVAGQSAFAKANAAYRRGRSDHLMGAAAGYYSAIGREHIEKAKREASAAADALVDSQSSSTMLDLHGVTVQDAVRIASDRVTHWWESLGDTKYALGGWNPAREGYRIVTGLGRHSRDGAPRLGPAVARTLAREGWRVEVGEGVLTVTGMARRR